MALGVHVRAILARRSLRHVLRVRSWPIPSGVRPAYMCGLRARHLCYLQRLLRLVRCTFAHFLSSFFSKAYAEHVLCVLLISFVRTYYPVFFNLLDFPPNRSLSSFATFLKLQLRRRESGAKSQPNGVRRLRAGEVPIRCRPRGVR